MTQQQFDECAAELERESLAIATAKRPGYTQANVDVLHNFKSVASKLGLTPMQVWGVYFLKHIEAICSFAKDPAIPQAEAITGRFCDANNYLKLGYGLMVEAAENKLAGAISASDGR